MKKNIAIEKLIVNPENYRFDPVDKQEEAIDLMLEEKGKEIVNLAQHIYNYGLDKAKDIRVTEIKKELFLVLDGNRRVTAIKCLQNPEIVKHENLKDRFKKILEGSGSIPSEINCFIYTNENEAAEWIKLDHTGKNDGIGQDPWEPSAKERFDYKFGGKISPAMQIIKLFEERTNREINKKSLKISTVNRIISNPESRSYLGIDVQAGKVILISEIEEVLNRLDKLFNKIISDDVAVKEVYHANDAIEFMKKLFINKPCNVSKVTTITPSGKIRSVPPKMKSLPKTTSRNVLIPKDFELRIYEPKLNNIYHELKEIPLSKATNAIGVLFRVFLETTLDYYAYKFGMSFSDNAKLTEKINKITTDLEKRGIANSRQLKPIRSTTVKGKTILSINNFHEYVHSFKLQPVSSDLITIWDNLQEFFGIIWQEIAEKEKPKK